MENVERPKNADLPLKPINGTIVERGVVNREQINTVFSAGGKRVERSVVKGTIHPFMVVNHKGCIRFTTFPGSESMFFQPDFRLNHFAALLLEFPL